MTRRSPRVRRQAARRTSVLAALLCAAVGSVAAPGAARAAVAPGDSVDANPAASWGWEEIFHDGFDGPAGEAPGQWHQMPGWGLPTQNGQGQLDVGHLAQIRSTSGWALPAGTQVRVTASLLMPDTGTNYTALWVQHPDPTDPREIDVVESYGPLKPTGVQLGSHLCYDETLDDGVDQCADAGRAPELFPVTQAFLPGALPWEAFWQYSADFTVGGEQVVYGAEDGSGNVAYTVASTPDGRRVPGNALPFHLRLSNKDVDPEYAVPGGVQPSMLVDWVSVEVKYPDPVSPPPAPTLAPATPVPPSEVPVS